MTNPATRVRFAPSPTGYLHVGGARTALFNWLYARHTGGAFLLRIEDTDRERSSDEHTQVILDGLTWLGLDWDEEPRFQGAGLERHRALADRLVAAGHAYEQEGAVWFRMPHEELSWSDAVHGALRFDGGEIKDWVILRSDRTPTYNFTVVADDLDMEITLVLRGDDHISNTPKQLAVYRALGVTPPTFGHVPMIHGPDGRKMSKRHGAVAVGDYRHAGILPGAMRNFLALLGWSAGDDRELFFEIDEMVRAFTLKGVHKKSAIFDQTKLEWMNGQYLSRTEPQTLIDLTAGFLAAEHGIDVDAHHDRLLDILRVVRERARTVNDLAFRAAVRIDATLIERDAKAEKWLRSDLEGFRRAIAETAARVENIDETEWTPEPLEATLRDLAATMDLGLGKVMQPVRIALTGGTVSEPVNDLLAVVGKAESLRRLHAAAAWQPAEEAVSEE